MGQVIVDMLPLMLGAALVPVWVIILLFVLRGEDGLLKGTAMVAGATVARLLQGVLFGFIIGSTQSADDESGSGLIAATLLTVLGLLLYISAIKQWRNEPDPDAPPPMWMTMFENISALKAFGIGALFVLLAAKMWVFTMGAVGAIQDSSLGMTSSIIAFVIYVIGAEIFLLAPLVAYVVAPKQAATTLERTSLWLEKHNRVIVIGVSLVFGTLFLWKGIAGLTS